MSDVKNTLLSSNLKFIFLNLCASLHVNNLVINSPSDGNDRRASQRRLSQMGIKQNSWKVCKDSPTIRLIFLFKVQKCTYYVRWKVFTIRGSMRETWTHDTDSVRLLLWIAVAVDDMFILYLRIVSVYIVSKLMQNYEINSILMSLFYETSVRYRSASRKFGGYWQNGEKDLVESVILFVILRVFTKNHCHTKSNILRRKTYSTYFSVQNLAVVL